ncbi:MAG: NADH-quinone oxidoreductase subunit E [Planctomycetes bacterium RBG_13_60_9]|nr:MAG: NADH-quinone oxidoreductase subunit E [Planctomycetes bacterium RBG_13_60_9]
MLTEEEQKEIDAEIAKYLGKRAAGPEALKIVQKHRGWISDESLQDVARYLEMTDDELESVATCYNFIFRKPVGRHVIVVCDSITCWIMGYESILDHLERRLGIKPGQTTGDGRFTLLPGACLGACDRAPVMTVDDQLHVELTPAKIDEILSSCQ